MSRTRRAVVAFSILALVAGAATFFRLTLDRLPRQPALAPPTAAPPRLEGSVYDLGLHVRDADGVVRGLDDLRGHPVLASMFFASCPSVCPLLIDEMKRVAETAPSGVGDDLRILLVSFDPARDTPAVLLDVARRHGLDVRRWRIAVAPDEATARGIAAVLGIRYRASAQGMFDHTTAMTVLDRQGEVVGRTESPAAVRALLAAAVERGPTAAR